MNKEEYLNKILAEIDKAKLEHRNGIFKIREKLPDSVAIYTRDYLIANTQYRIEFKKCTLCAFEWDIIIIF